MMTREAFRIAETKYPDVAPKIGRAPGYLEFEVGNQSGSDITVTIRVVDSEGTPVQRIAPLRLWVSDDNTTGAPSSLSPGDFVTITGVTLTAITGEHLECLTDETGEIQATLTAPAIPDQFYVWASCGSILAVSDVLDYV